MTQLPLTLLMPGGEPWFPPLELALDEPNGLLAIGGDLSPARLLLAYRRGIFPWYSQDEPILWWSPDPRCVFRTDAIHVSASLRRQLKRSTWTISTDRAFRAVVEACGGPRRGQEGTWIVPPLIDAYVKLHRLGHAHSVEVWDGETLVGGIYGIAIGRAFAGESMFSRGTGGSKIALLALARTLAGLGMPLLDAQVPNPHLATLGAVAMPRAAFIREWAALAQAPPVSDWTRMFSFRHAAELAATC